MSLKISSLKKSFGDKKIFDDFSYEFRDTGICIISGESGIGKTTLLRMIAGLDKNFEGKITHGESASVSFMFQEYRLFPNLTALDNVLLASFSEYTEEDKKRTVDLLSTLRFTREDMDLFPSKLSGGMAQRISFARAVMKKSKILILDEPTKEIDSELRAIMLDVIKKEAKERLVLIVTHEEDAFISANAEYIKIQAPLN